ncbi:MAG: hypothetical protein JW757_02010 [Anaerolineales bacterium]|nr:hypothetical protein [Anaerolineales bacterium]
MVTLDRKVIRNTLILVLLILVLADLIGPVIGVTSTFSLDRPGSLGVWFESLLYILSAGLLALIAIEHIQRKDPTGWRWGLFALFILYLSANTNARLNSKIFFTLFRLYRSSLMYIFLQLLFIVLVITLIVIFWPVLRGLPAQYRRMLIRSGVIFGMGAILVDAVSSFFFHGTNTWFYLLEEMLEYSGFVLFIDAILAYLGAEMGTIRLKLRQDDPPMPEGS